MTEKRRDSNLKFLAHLNYVRLVRASLMFSSNLYLLTSFSYPKTSGSRTEEKRSVLTGVGLLDLRRLILISQFKGIKEKCTH